MKVGILLQAVDPLGEFAARVQEVEALGFDHLLVADSGLQARDVYPYLTVAVENSRRLLLGTGITHPHTRHPATTANAIATLADFSHGRIVLGIGTGDRVVWPLGAKKATLTTLRVMVDACRRLLAGDVVDLDGTSFSLVGAQLRFRPSVDVPIWVAGSGPKVLELAGKIGDAVIAQIGLTTRHVEWALERVRQGAEASARPVPEFGVIGYGSIDPERKKARDESRYIAAWFAQTAPYHCELADVEPALISDIRQAYGGGELHDAHSAAALVTESMLDRLTLSGTEDEVGGRIEELRANGVQRVTFMAMGSDRWASIRRFAKVARAL